VQSRGVHDGRRQRECLDDAAGDAGGVASSLTALAGVGTFLTNSCADKRVVAMPPVVAAPAPTVRAGVDPDQSIIGDWARSTSGVTAITSDGTLDWNQHPNGLRLRVAGTWTCTDPKARQFLFRWHHGFSGMLTLALDGRTISVANRQTGAPIFSHHR